MADKLRFPKSRKVAVLFQFKMLQRFRRLLGRMQGRGMASENFGQLLGISAYDDTGISYRIPDHERSERSSQW